MSKPSDEGLLKDTIFIWSSYWLVFSFKEWSGENILTKRSRLTSPAKEYTDII